MPALPDPESDNDEWDDINVDAGSKDNSGAISTVPAPSAPVAGVVLTQLASMEQWQQKQPGEKPSEYNKRMFEARWTDQIF
jgi:hypothetical protein